MGVERFGQKDRNTRPRSMICYILRMMMGKRDSAKLTWIVPIAVTLAAYPACATPEERGSMDVCFSWLPQPKTTRPKKAPRN